MLIPPFCLEPSPPRRLIHRPAAHTSVFTRLFIRSPHRALSFQRRRGRKRRVYPSDATGRKNSSGDKIGGRHHTDVRRICHAEPSLALFVDQSVRVLSSRRSSFCSKHGSSILRPYSQLPKPLSVAALISAPSRPSTYPLPQGTRRAAGASSRPAQAQPGRRGQPRP